MMLAILFSFFISVLTNPAHAEPSERWLVELKSVDATCLHEWWTIQGLDQADLQIKPLPVGNWWVVEVPSHLSTSLKAQPCIARIMKDQKINWRKQPNDPAYINQGDMNLIGMPKAWDITTGGLTAAGDTIVVALIDDGYETTHPDLDGNLFINHLEIADDQLDNDGNGYVDDRVGYNVGSGNDHHSIRTHGTSVAGIIGAEGNNGIGVSGVNWKVNLLLLSGADFESSVIEAYQYILDMRNLYTESGGQKGAFIVVTNLSGGIEYAFASEHPLWCEMYDKLGEKGILSVTAAPNEDISVDVLGDMPTTCTSPYMVAVTNVDLSDVLVGNAGYGETSIDIGAPGHGTVTTASDGAYEGFDGTSAAAPHVAGAIGLLYSTPCESFLANLADEPAETAEKIRDIILWTGDSNNSLDEITVTGRRLQVDAALRATLSDCLDTTDKEITITSIRPNPAFPHEVKVYFESPQDYFDTFFEIFDAVGAKVAEIGIDFVLQEQGYVSIDGRSLPAGVYFITLRNGKDKVTRKLVMLN